MLMSWSSPFQDEQGKPSTSNFPPSPQLQKQKISSMKQLEMVDSENTLADFVPPQPSHEEKNVYDMPLYEPVQKTKEQDLVEKLNYMIFLLEEQRDERTGHVTEELILYLFLGIFTIFVLDTFVKTGKYSR